MLEEICLPILKAISGAIFEVVGFVVGIFVETVIELRWVILVVLAVMALLWFWMQNDPHRPHTRPYHADPTPSWISR